jgi:hypothetical protein
MLTKVEREIAIAMVEALVEYGLNENLYAYGRNGAQNWFLNEGLECAGFGASAGETKICIWHGDLTNWVIKVGFVGNGYGGRIKNHAAMEYNVYCKAEEAGLAHYFPETIYLGEFGGHSFYIQQWAECSEEGVSSEWYARLQDQYDEEGSDYDSDDLWCEIDNMTDDEKAMLTFNDKELCSFLWRNGVGDLHEGNFGFVNGCLTIVDFSGYHPYD